MNKENTHVTPQDQVEVVAPPNPTEFTEGEETREAGPKEQRRCSTRKFVLIAAIVCCLVLPVLLLIVAILLSYSWLGGYDEPVQVPALSSAALVQTQGFDDQQQQHVIIVGAGAAGLSAGYTLEKLGISYIILEASSRFGGRVKRSDGFANVPLDMGAEWIHANPQILQDLLQVDNEDSTDAVDIADLPQTIEYNPQTFTFWGVGGRAVRRDWARFYYLEYKFYNTTWSNYLEDFLVPAVENNIVYGAVVEMIDYSSDGDKPGVQVVTRDGEVYEADRAIVATPVSILRDDGIIFSPSIDDERRHALDTVDWQPGFKVMLQFKENFYSDLSVKTTIFDFLSDDSMRIFYNAAFRKPTEENILGIFAVGHQAEEWIGLDDDAIVKDALEKLDMIYKGKPKEHYQGHIVQNWAREPYIRGAYAFDCDDEVLKEPLANNKVYFAGDYLGGYEMSTVHGAAMSGRQAVIDMLSS